MRNKDGWRPGYGAKETMRRYLTVLAGQANGDFHEALRIIDRGEGWRDKCRATDSDFRDHDDRLLGRSLLSKPVVSPFRDFRAQYFADRGATFPHMEPWIDAYENMDIRRCIIVGPPEHARTTVMTVQRLAHLACQEARSISLQEKQDWPLRAAVVSGGDDLAERMGWQLSKYLTDPFFSGEMLRDYGPFKGTGRSARWTASQMYLAWRGAEEKDPSFQFLGWRGALQSARLTDAVMDDADDPLNSPSQRAFILRFLDQILLPRLGTHGRLWYLCNRVDELDVAQELIERSEDGTWHGIVQPAIQSNGTALWEEHIPLAHIDEMKKQMRNDRLFSLVYLAKPTRDGDGSFPSWKLEGSKDPQRVVGQIPEGTRTYMLMDPASSGGAAIMCGARDPKTGKMFVIDAEWAAKRRSAGLILWIKEYLNKYHPREFGLEAQGGGFQLFADNRELEDLLRDHGCHLVTLQTGRNKRDKEIGVDAMSDLFDPDPAVSVISVPWGDEYSQRKMQRLYDQLATYDPDGKMAYDLVMTLWFFVRLTRNQRGPGIFSRAGQKLDHLVTAAPWMRHLNPGPPGHDPMSRYR